MGQRRRGQAEAAQREPEFDDIQDDDDLEPFVEDFDTGDGKLGKKKLAKLQAKAEKRSQREFVSFSFIYKY